MDKVGDLVSGVKKPLRKRRTNLFRRPSNEAAEFQRNSVSVSSTPSSEVQKSSDDNEVLGENVASASSSGKDNKTSEIGAASDGIGIGKRVRKVKLKVGGVTRTIHTKSSSDASSVAGTSTANTPQSDAVYPSHKLGHQGHIMREEGALRPLPWKDFSRTGFSFENVSKLKHEKSHKMKHATKKSLSDEVFDEEDDDDDEIRYLQKLKSSKTSSSRGTGHEDEKRGKKLRKLSVVLDRDTRGYDLAIGDYDYSRSSKESKKSHSQRAAEHFAYMKEEEGEELVPYVEIEPESRTQRSESVEVNRSSITTRRKAIQTGTDNSLSQGPGLIQFPDGLPPAPPRKPKEQLTEVEQQLKRAEAAKRRKMQNEKAALESQAEAIRRILGQDSSRKRREDKIKKRQEDLAQERNLNAATLSPNIVRWVMRPSGTIVTFPDEIGLPSIFEPKPCSYPPPREKCAGPECTNTYKYRDSKSKLPLCSLHCYKAINERCNPLASC